MQPSKLPSQNRNSLCKTWIQIKNFDITQIGANKCFKVNLKKTQNKYNSTYSKYLTKASKI